MIEKLSDITASQLVDIFCGDYSPLIGRHEIVSDDKAEEVAHHIMLEYHKIANPTQVKSFISTSAKSEKSRCALVVYKICDDLIKLGHYDKVREVMASAKINTSSMSDSRLKSEVTYRYKRAESDIEREESEFEKQTPEQIRMNFDSQTAALMAHFHFQIDPTTMKATLYAQLVSRFNAEIKAQIAHSKKK